MDKNRIEGRHGAMSWHNTAKSPGMPVEVNPAAVRWSNVPLPGEIPPLSGGGKSAEAIVVEETSRSAHEHSKVAGATHPMKGRTNEEGIDPVTDGPTDDARRRGESESHCGGRHGAPQERTMIEEILEPEFPKGSDSDTLKNAKPFRMDGAQRSQNLARAWQRVRRNKGAPGIDGMTVTDFPAFAREHWPRIATAIREGNYRPAPVRRVFIPKPDGTQRPLGIPTVLDRVIQQAVAQVLSPLFEAGFSDHSHGYRPGRSAHKAVTVMEEGWKEGRRHAVECDLKSFFDTVNHDRLMNALKEKIQCPRVLGLIRRYLMAGVELPDGTREATHQGVPQGGPLSPLLANIALDPLDKELECPSGLPLPEIIFRRRKMQSAWPERSAGNHADTSSRDMPTTSSCW
jgi:retron-type reverse transcriptase